MKRLHVHVAVEDLTHSIGFDSALFAAGRRASCCQGGRDDRTNL
jgi:hypothetical protein